MLMLEYHLILICVPQKAKHTNSALLVRTFSRKNVFFFLWNKCNSPCETLYVFIEMPACLQGLATQNQCLGVNSTLFLYTGIQVIDWLLKWCFVSDRDTGVNLACMLLEDAHLQPVGLTSKLSFKRKTQFQNVTTFLDDTDALYRFVSSL